jgi:hypothetical protein
MQAKFISCSSHSGHSILCQFIIESDHVTHIVQCSIMTCCGSRSLTWVCVPWWSLGKWTCLHAYCIFSHGTLQTHGIDMNWIQSLDIVFPINNLEKTCTVRHKLDQPNCGLSVDPQDSECMVTIIGQSDRISCILLWH